MTSPKASWLNSTLGSDAVADALLSALFYALDYTCLQKQKHALQVAIITGSGQGLGAAAAKLFAQHGAKLVVTDLDGSKAKQVSKIRMQAVVLSQLDSSAPYMLTLKALPVSGR